MTADLVQFLRDRYDEEAAEAQAAEKRTTTTRRMIQGQWVEDTVQPPEWRRSVWPPARVLAEVEAKRALLDGFLPDATAADEQINEEWHAGSALAGDLLCLLALPYADHANYREEWRP